VNDLKDELRSIRENYVQDDYVVHTKTAIRETLQIIDPAATIEDTHYFNHSAIPDFVVTWSGQRNSRPLYLRGSYASIVAARDVEEIQTGDPVFLSLATEQDYQTEQPPISPVEIRNASTKKAHTMLTDVGAIEEISAPESTGDSPLAGLVKANFLRGGRGLVDQARAAVLTNAVSQGESLTFGDIVRENFFEDAVLRMERTATLLDLALSSSADDQLSNLSALTGQLSQAELRLVLPWLLRSDDVTPSPRFWRQLGAMMTLADLEAISTELDGLPLDRLVVPNVENWMAVRAFLGINSNINTEDQPLPEGWSFLGNVLKLDHGEARVFVSTDGRSLRGRDGGRLPRWTEIQQLLTSFKLASVNLKGITRSVRIDAEMSDDIRTDVEDVAVSLDDDYFVAEATLRFSRPEVESGHTHVVIRFAKGLAVAETGASINDLVRATSSVLNFGSQAEAGA